MDLTNYEERYAQVGDRHPTYPQYRFNGIEWEETDPVWDFSFKDDWLLVVVVGVMVVGGLLLLKTII